MRTFVKVVCLAAALLAPMPGSAQQEPSAETMAAARELVATSRAGDQFKALMPILIQHLKPAIVQGRPQVERDFDAIMPVLLEGMTSRLNELTDIITRIYAQNFTAAELRELTAFYRTGKSFWKRPLWWRSKAWRPDSSSRRASSRT